MSWPTHDGTRSIEFTRLYQPYLWSGSREGIHFVFFVEGCEKTKNMRKSHKALSKFLGIDFLVSRFETNNVHVTKFIQKKATVERLSVASAV